MKNIRLASSVFLLSLNTLFAQTTLTVTSEVLHEINDDLFGQFMERPSWGKEIGPESAVDQETGKLPDNVVKLLSELNAPSIRFPGGTDIGHMDLRDMITGVPGRAAERPVSIGKDGDEVTNTFGFDEFLHLCKNIGAKPLLPVSVRQGTVGKITVEEAAFRAAALVAYCNAPVDANLPEDLLAYARLRAANGHPEPYAVQEWQIGNETWFFDREFKNKPDERNASYRATVEAIADAMIAVDPGITFLMDGAQWTDSVTFELAKKYPDNFKAFVFHIYQPWGIKDITGPDGEKLEIADLSTEEVFQAWVSTPGVDAEGQAGLWKPLIKKAREGNFKIAVTEWNWNGWWSMKGPKPAEKDSDFARGLGAAGFLHGLMRNGDVIIMAHQSMMIGNSWGIAAVAIDPKGERDPYIRPTGKVTALYAAHHGHKRLKTTFEKMPTYKQPYKVGLLSAKEKVAYLDVVATRDESTLYLHMINRSLKNDLPIDLDLEGLSLANGPAEWVQLRMPDTGEDTDWDLVEQTTQTLLLTQSPEGHTPISVPAASVSVLKIKLK